VPGVRKATVDFKTKRADVSFDSSKATVSDLIAALEKAGFGAKVEG